MPGYKNLSLACISNYVSNRQQLMAYLPDNADLPKIPKQWIVNVCAAVLGDNFRQWVAQ